MKEAAGEANMTVVTIVLIAIVLGVGAVIVGNLMKNAEGNVYNTEAACADAGWTWNAQTNKCVAPSK